MTPSRVLNSLDPERVQREFDVDEKFVKAVEVVLSCLKDSGDQWKCKWQHMDYLYARYLMFEYNDEIVNTSKPSGKWVTIQGGSLKEYKFKMRFIHKLQNCVA